MIVELIIAFVVATILANTVEWISHKYLLHGLGKKKGSFFFYHWRHHFTARKNNNADHEVYNPNFLKNMKTKDFWKEVGSLLLIIVFNLNWLFIWPMFFYCTVFWTIAYYVLHYSCHAFPSWGKKWLRWHWDHHMFDQNANYGVTLPIIDYVLGTRKKHIEDNDK